MRNTVMFVALVLLLAACGGREEVETKNMDQIHREQGVPVTVQLLQPQPFVQQLTYTARLEGIRRTVQGSMIGGKVQVVHARVGDRVQRDQVLVEFAEDNPASQYTQARAAYENARKTYEKMRSLYEVGGISELEMDNTRTGFELAEAGFVAAGKMVKPQAPFSGIVTAMNVRLGDSVAPDDPLFTISQVDRMRTRVFVPEADIGMIQRGQDVTATWQEHIFTGRISQVAYDLNRDMQGFGVDIVLANPDRVFRSGMTAQVSVEAYRNDSAIVVPRKLTRTDETGTYVFVAEGGNAAKRYIEVGRQSDLNLEVTAGLQAGDSILTTGLNLIKDGAKLKIQS
ncbi:MAG: efflux RND transporter periplasmic adaptor subunit [Candidatus Cloacimonetes bacterium]|nr:efflux RND transporter periplasmic adaptor subunit [Candidatus Cloacimonadota bacterium]